MRVYLELTEDELVERLSELQRLARRMVEAGNAEPYNKLAHEKACEAVTKRMKHLASDGDIV